MIECRVEGMVGEACRFSDSLCYEQSELELDPSLALEDQYKQSIEVHGTMCLRTQELLVEIESIRTINPR